MADLIYHGKSNETAIIGKLGRAHGVTGEVRLYSLSDIPDRFNDLKEVWWEKQDTKPKRLKVVGIRPVGRFFLIRFEGYDNPEKVQELGNGYLVVSKNERPPLPENRYYIDDIIGLKALDVNNHEIGHVKDVYQPGPHDIFEIVGKDGEILLPVIDDVIKEINIMAGYIIVKVPEYL